MWFTIFVKMDLITLPVRPAVNELMNYHICTTYILTVMLNIYISLCMNTIMHYSYNIKFLPLMDAIF